MADLWCSLVEALRVVLVKFLSEIFSASFLCSVILVPSSEPYSGVKTCSLQNHYFSGLVFQQASVVQSPDNFILWISHYPTVSICANISVFLLVQANMHTPIIVKFGSVLKLFPTFNVKYSLDNE